MEEKKKTIRDYFTDAEWITFFVVIGLGLLMRWIGLDERPLHHDESLHVMYGKYYFDHPTFQFYKYDPMLHGPLLYITLFFMYNALGVSEWAARFPIAVIGSAMLFLPLIFRRFFSPLAVLALTAAIAFSPTLTYWSRFIREDYLCMLGLFCVIFGLFNARKSYKALWVGLGVAIQMCTKENWYIHFVLLLGYLVFEWGMNFYQKFPFATGVDRLIKYVKENYISVIAASLLVSLLFCLTYSAGFQYPEGILDGLYRKSIQYWSNQHGIERIKGPFLFNVYVFGWYETLFFVSCLISLWFFYRQAPRIVQIVGGAGLLIAFILYANYRNSTEADITAIKLFAFFRAKDALDIAGIVLLPLQGLLCTLTHLLKKEQALAISGYAFWGSLFTYSYLGEKVPWLSMYALVAGMIYVALFFDNQYKKSPIKSWKEYPPGEILFRSGAVMLLLWMIFCVQEPSISESMKFLVAVLLIGGTLTLLGILELIFKRFEGINLAKFLFGILSLYSLRAAYLTNFVFAGEANELLSQVHTTREMRDVAVNLRHEIENQSRGYRPHVYVDGDPVWPLSWYFRDLPEYKFQGVATEAERNTFKYQFLTYDANKTAPDGYQMRTLKLRGWWVPDYRVMNLRKFLWYAITHDPWSGTGYSYATFLVKKEEETQ
jgi:uncharacterized protein (TIGR03663 family)